MKIDFVFTDIDGCLAPRNYDITGAIQSGPTPEVDSAFEFYRGFKDLPLVLCTGRSWEATEGIARRVGNPRLVICEGLYIVNGEGGYSLLDTPKYSSFKCNVGVLKQIEASVDAKVPEIEATLRARYHAFERVVKAPGKKFTLCYGTPYQGRHEASERVDEGFFASLVFDSIPSRLMADIQRGDVLADVFMESVIFDLPIGKKEAVLHAVDVLGTKSENIAFIEDREIGPLTIAGFACCPNNAKPEIREYVEQRQREGTGYLSPYSYTEAEIDILTKIASRK